MRYARRSSLVWVGFDGECATVNTSLERYKGRDLQHKPRLSLLVVDPDNTNRFIQIRGDAEFVTEGAIEDLDATTRAYTAKPCFYGYIYPVEQRARETRVICRIHARRVALEAIYSHPRETGRGSTTSSRGRSSSDAGRDDLAVLTVARRSRSVRSPPVVRIKPQARARPPG